MAPTSEIEMGERVYRMRGVQRALYLLFAAMLVLAALGMWRVVGHATHAATLPEGLAGAAAAVAAFYLALSALRSRLQIDGTQVRVQGALGERTFDAADVEGYRTLSGRYGSYQVLCLKDGGARIQFSQYATDEAFREWLSRLPDLDARDREAALKKIAEDPDLGATPEERQNALSSAKWTNVAACAVVAMAAIASLWGPPEFAAAATAVLALGPMTAAYLLFRSPLLYGLMKPKRDPRTELSFLLLVSVVGLVAGDGRVNLVSLAPLGPAIAGVAIVFCAAFLPAVWKSAQRGGALIAMILFGLFYSYGLAAAINRVADRSTPEMFRVEVLAQHVTHGSRSTSYHLTLEPWGPYSRVNSMPVSRSVYEQTQPGTTICLDLHAGFLGAAWYQPIDCAEQQP
ncbi:MAG TPA: hypothetical protein VMD25_04485 [Acidobacteriaceae bacterium]|nr:hypothetical protein [Acidobacteriaceae bacterium]